MSFLRHIIGLVIALLFSALSALAVPMMPAASHQAEFFPLPKTVTAEHTDVHFAAPAPPITLANVALTGASVAEHGNGFVMLGHETHLVSLSFGAGFDATNRTLTPAQQRAFDRLEGEGVTIASPNAPINGTGDVNPLLDRIRGAGGTLDISRGEISAQDLAALSRASGNEMAIFRDRATGQLRIRELGPQMGQIPENSRLIIHSQPGSGPLSVQPSTADRAALVQLNQRSSVIINSDGTFTVRFRPDNVGDGPITPIGE